MRCLFDIHGLDRGRSFEGGCLIEYYVLIDRPPSTIKDIHSEIRMTHLKILVTIQSHAAQKIREARVLGFGLSRCFFSCPRRSFNEVIQKMSHKKSTFHFLAAFRLKNAQNMPFYRCQVGEKGLFEAHLFLLKAF